MRRILFVLVVVIAWAGVVAYMAPASGQADKATPDDLAGKLARREVQRSPLSIPGREMVQVETLIPAGVESGWPFIQEKRSATSSRPGRDEGRGTCHRSTAPRGWIPDPAADPS